MRAVALAATASLTAVVVIASAACGAFSGDEQGDPVSPIAAVDGGDGGEGAPPVGGPAASSFVVKIQGASPVELTRGKRVDVIVEVERRNEFRGEVVISVVDLPSGVAAESLTILAGETAGALGLTATAAVPHGLASPVLRASDPKNEVVSSDTKFDLLLRGPPGTLDESFGAKGVVERPLGGARFSAMASQADGKLAYAGSGGGTPNIVVGRLQANGTTDAAFGTQGTGRFAFGAGADEAVAVLSQPDGKIVVVGSAVNETKVGLLRLSATTGTLDPSFAVTGKTVLGTDLVTLAARLADDGSIFVLGRTSIFDLAVGKVLPSGALDLTFGTSGWVAIPFTSYPTALRLTGYDIAVSPTSVVISCVVGRAQGADFRIGLATMTRSGQGTPIFGQTTVANISQYSIPLVLRGDGAAVVAFNNIAVAEQMTLYRFLPGGQAQDPNFGGGSPVVAPANDVPQSMVEDDTNRLLLAVQAYVPPTKFRLLRRVPTGGPDPAFGVAGLSETLIGDESLSKSVVLQKDRRILVGGDRTTAAVPALAIVRYWP